MSWKVKVYNDGPYPIKETFKQDIIEIPAGGFIEMDRDDAVDFKGQYRPILTDGEKNPLPQGFKRIRIPDLYNRPKASETLRHPVTGKVAKDQAEFDSWTAANLDAMASEDGREAFRESAKDKEIAELKAKLAAAEAKKGPGRPKKDPNEQKGPEAA